MDGFEQIRLWAANLHDEIVATGANPWSPISIVTGAAQHLDVELNELPVGDPLLKGARALFDEQFRAVCYEATADSGERALLIAHEVAHVRLHSTSASCNAHDIDASRSTETAPVGLQRVEDYGARERRELQANVFARELVFPRPLARRLYTDDGLGAAAISERLGLSLNLVRQQLFDALLLPLEAAVPLPSAAPAPSMPDASQQLAIAHRDSPFQLQAGPGTGKTRTLVDRIVSLLEEDSEPASFVVLTFSNRAAKELSERLSIRAPVAAPRIWTGTFHAFGLEIVRRYHHRFDLPPAPVLFDRSDAIAVLEEILPTLPLVHYRNLWDPALVLRDIVAAISRAKDEMTDPARYRALAQAMADKAKTLGETEAAAKCLEIARVYDLYEDAKRAAGAVDFGDLIMRPALLMESDAGLRLQLQMRHRHVLVDEYQDVNRASGRMLMALAGDGRRLWVVGDARQSIYRFRGASTTNMTAFASDYPGATVHQLSINYRSTKPIVDAFVASATHMGASAGMLPLALTAIHGAAAASRPEIRVHQTPDDELGGIAASVRELEAQGVALREQAVLCRTNAKLSDVADALEVRGIPVLHLGSLFEREEVRDLLSLLSLAIDRFSDGLARIAAMPRYDLALQDVLVVTAWLRQVAERPLSHLADAAAAPGLSADGAAAIARLASDLEGLSTSASPWEFLSTYLLDRGDIVRGLAKRTAVQDRMRAIALWQFLNFVREPCPGPSGSPIYRLLNRVRQLVLLAEERDLRQVPAAGLDMNAVRLMTVHGSKGLEFEAVHLPGLTVSSFPSSFQGQRCPPPIGMVENAEGMSSSEESRQSQQHEEECLFFVALSRARAHVRLYRARLTESGKNRSPSSFLTWLPVPLAREIPDPPTMPSPVGSSENAIIHVTHSADWAVTDARLKSYDDCPRRFFYTHVLGLGGARRTTAFSRSHDCLYDLVRWLGDARRDGNPTLEETEKEFDVIWKSRGPVDHAYAAEYRQLASRLVGSLVRSGAGRRFREAEPLAIDFPNGRVMLEPNELAELPDGTVVLRRVRTGRKRSDEYDRLEYTLYHMAGQAHFGAGFSVEATHLTDDTVEFVTITERKMATRRERSDSLLGEITAGRFPPKPNAVTCPRCPHFFICAATARGPVIIE